MPVIAPPALSPFGAAAPARFKAGAAAAAARPTMLDPQALEFDSLFSTSSVPPSPRPEDSTEGVSPPAKSADPFAELLDVVDDRINAAKGAHAELLCVLLLHMMPSR